MSQQTKDKKINRLIALFTNGEVEKCKRETKKVLEKYPSEPFLFNLLGVTHAETNLFEKAIAYYKKAIKLNPSYFEVYNNIGVAYNHWNKPDLAVESLRHAIKLNPNYAEAFNNLGNSQKELSDYEDAIESYENALKIDSNYIDALCNLGIVLGLVEKYSDAEEKYKKALALDPLSYKINYYFADNLFNQGFYDKAEKIAYRILEKNKSDPELNNLIGKILQKKGKIKSIGFFRRALKSTKRKDVSLNNIGTLLYEKRKITPAIKFF